MMLSVAASRYARALADSVLAPGSGMDPQDVSAQLRRFEELLASSGELRHVMQSPAVTSSKKRAVVAQFSDALGFAPKVRNFVYVLIDHRRISQLAEIREGFEQAIDEQTGFTRADVTSAYPLTDSQRQALESELNKLTGKRVRMHFSTDEALIGGATARIGSTVYDGSVRGHLESLRKRLTAD